VVQIFPAGHREKWRGYSLRYRAEIDGLRAVAIISVILFHAGFEFFSGGFVGVDIFFVISGYLITTIILAELDAGKFSIVNFYERRARRILPALYLVLAVCMPFAWLLLLPSDMTSFSKSLLTISAFISNIFFWSERGYFGTATELKPLIHTWSLAIEEQYYLIFPILLIVLANRRRVFLIITLTVAGVVSLGLSAWLTKVHADSAFYLLPTRFWELLIGSFVAIQGFYFKINSNDKPPYHQSLEIFGFILIIYSVLFFDNETSFPGYAALVPTVGAALIIHNATSNSLVGSVLSNKILVGIGLISYSAYLWHQPIFAFTRHHSSSNPSQLTFLVLAVFTLAIAFFSWKYIEQPFRNKEIWSRKHIFLFSFSGLVLFAAAGIIGWKTDGFMLRYSKEDHALLRSFIGGDVYNDARFDSLKLTDFDKDSVKKRVVVIGDSFGKDLVNAIAESRLSQYVQLSTHQINGECGNLYLNEDFSVRIKEVHLPRCQVLGWYQNDRLQKLIEQSDAIWLGSAWQPWVAELLPQSIKNIEENFKKPVLIFGRKSFGEISPKLILQLPAAQRYSHVEKMDAEHIIVNERMREILPAEQFVDISMLLCGDETFCRIFTDSGGLISFDGTHLTQDGAKYLGEALYRQPFVRLFLEK